MCKTDQIRANCVVPRDAVRCHPRTKRKRSEGSCAERKLVGGALRAPAVVLNVGQGACSRRFAGKSNFSYGKSQRLLRRSRHVVRVLHRLASPRVKFVVIIDVVCAPLKHALRFYNRIFREPPKLILLASGNPGAQKRRFAIIAGLPQQNFAALRMTHSRGVCFLHFAFCGRTEFAPTGLIRKTIVSAGGDPLIRRA